MPIIRIRPLPPIPKRFAVSFGRSLARQRRRAVPVSMDDLDYREVITAFLECGNSPFRDCRE